MTTRYKAKGIVLGHIKYGENAMIVHMLTDVLGRQSYMVQGIRSSKGHGSKQGLFQPMFALEYEGFQTSHSELHRMSDIHSGMLLSNIPYDISKSTISLFMSEVLYRLVKNEEPNRLLFDFVWGSVEALDKIDEGVANFHLWFLASLSRFLGFSPGNEYIEGGWFDMLDGLYTPTMPLHDYAMNPFYSTLLRDLHDCDVAYLGEIALNRTQRVEMLNLLMSYYSMHLEQTGELKSIKVLQEVF